MANIINPKDLIESDVFEMLGLQNLSDSEKEETMKKLIGSVQNRVIIRIDDLVGDQDSEQFHQLLDSADDEKISQFLEQKQINVGQLVAEEAMLLKSELVTVVAQAKE